MNINSPSLYLRAAGTSGYMNLSSSGSMYIQTDNYLRILSGQDLLLNSNLRLNITAPYINMVTNTAAGNINIASQYYTNISGSYVYINGSTLTCLNSTSNVTINAPTIAMFANSMSINGNHFVTAPNSATYYWHNIHIEKGEAYNKNLRVFIQQMLPYSAVGNVREIISLILGRYKDATFPASGFWDIGGNQIFSAYVPNYSYINLNYLDLNGQIQTQNMHYSDLSVLRDEAIPIYNVY